MDRRRVFPIFLIVFVNFLGANIVLPVLPLFAQDLFNAAPTQITFLNTSYFIALFIAGPIIGRLSDQYGRRPILLISQIGTVVSFIMLGGAGSIGMMYAARALDGITGGNLIVAQAYLTDITPRKHRTQALGLAFLAFALGLIFGPAIGGIISAFFGPHATIWVAAIISLITVLLTWFTLEESLTPEQRGKRGENAARIRLTEVAANPSLLLILLIAFLGQGSFSLFQSTFSLYGDRVLFVDFPDNIVAFGVGILFALAGISQVVTQTLLIKRAVERFGEYRLVIMGALMRSFGMWALSFMTSPWPGPLGMMPIAMGAGLMMPSLQSLTASSVPDNLRGGILGLYNSVVSLALIVGSTAAGYLFEWHPNTPYHVAGFIYMILVIPAFLLMRLGGKTPAEGVEDDTELHQVVPAPGGS